MEENDGKMVRLRLVFDDHQILEDLDKSQRSQGLRRCWFLLKPEITSIGDLASQIRECFGLRHRIVLFMDDFVLPSFESTCIITDKDIIRVKKKAAKQKDICKPCDGQNLLQDSENARIHDLAFNKNLLVDGKSQENSQGHESNDREILTSCMKNSVHLDPPGDIGSTKQKRKRSKKLLDSKGHYDEINHENEFGPSNNSDVRKEKQRRPQMVPHSSDGEEVQPGYIHFQRQDHGTQEADEIQKSLLFDERSSIKEQDRNKEKASSQTIDDDQCFKVDGAPISNGILPLPKPPISDGILPLPKPEVISSGIDITKPHKHIIDFEILLPLRRLPAKGDMLAYRFVEPSSSAYLELSSPQVGMVSSFDYKTLQIILLPVLDYVLLLDENPHGTIVQPNASRYKEDGSLEIEYLSLVDVRLVKDHGPQEKEKEKACRDDQARKDNWEEALVKGSGNEPNASTAEQSNSWAPWIPNKSANVMSWSFKQPNAPFAGRGNGRTNWAPNRFKNRTNWNPNRNNATWNPNRNNTRFTATDNTVTLPWSDRAQGLPISWQHHENNNFLPDGKFSCSGKQ